MRVIFVDKGHVLTLGTGGGNASTLTGALSGSGTVQLLAGPHEGRFRDSPLTLAGDQSPTPWQGLTSFNKAASRLARAMVPRRWPGGSSWAAEAATTASSGPPTSRSTTRLRWSCSTRCTAARISISMGIARSFLPWRWPPIRGLSPAAASFASTGSRSKAATYRQASTPTASRGAEGPA